MRVSSTPVVSVEEDTEGVRIRTDDGERVAAGIFVAAGAMRQRAPFAADLGLAMLESGSIEIDEFGRTSFPGIFAAGDLATAPVLPGPMASVLLSGRRRSARRSRHHPVARLSGQTAPTSTAEPVAAGSA